MGRRLYTEQHTQQPPKQNIETIPISRIPETLNWISGYLKPESQDNILGQVTQILTHNPQPLKLKELPWNEFNYITELKGKSQDDLIRMLNSRWSRLLEQLKEGNFSELQLSEAFFSMNSIHVPILGTGGTKAVYPLTKLDLIGPSIKYIIPGNYSLTTNTLARIQTLKPQLTIPEKGTPLVFIFRLRIDWHSIYEQDNGLLFRTEVATKQGKRFKEMKRITQSLAQPPNHISRLKPTINTIEITPAILTKKINSSDVTVFFLTEAGFLISA